MNFIITVVFPIVLCVAGIIGGAWASELWSKHQGNKRYSRRNDLLGTWQSTWQEADNPTGWITEEVEISVAKGRLQLVNSHNTGGYLWHGQCELHDERYLYGHWRSRKPGAQSTGVFCFFALPHGRVLVGQAFGLDPAGIPRNTDWILGREPRDIESGKQWLSVHATHYRAGA